MALRWDLKPLFPGKSEDTFVGRITRHSAISGGVAFVALVAGTWQITTWEAMAVVIAVLAAYNAGEMNVPFDDDDDEPDTLEDGTIETPHDRFYYAGREHRNPER